MCQDLQSYPYGAKEYYRHIWVLSDCGRVVILNKWPCYEFCLGFDNRVYVSYPIQQVWKVAPTHVAMVREHYPHNKVFHDYLTYQDRSGFKHYVALAWDLLYRSFCGEAEPYYTHYAFV